MKDALEQWDKQFEIFVGFGKRMPTKRKCIWIYNQKSKMQGIRGKVEFERENGNGNTDWNDRMSNLEIELRKKNIHSFL